jgi:hypothetical protein
MDIDPSARASLTGQDPSPTPTQLINAAPVVKEPAVVVKKNAALREMARELYFRLPALAIPTVSKSSFVCPETHLAKLRKTIPQVEKIVVVGWRAGEQHFLRELAAGLRKPVDILVACGNLKDSNETLDRLKAVGLSGSASRAASGGFTDLVRNHELESFL